MRRAVIVVALVGCRTSGPDDIVGPFTGPTHRYVVDAIRVPTSNTETRTYGGDLDGNGQVDNALGMAISTQAGQGNVTDRGADMIAAGVIASSLEIVADDLQNDPTVAVRYLGTADSPYVELGGRIEDGWVRSNLTAFASQPGEAELHLPVFKDADPSLVKAIGIQMILAPDGSGGFEATVHGAVPADNALWEAIHRGIAQMVAADPSDHLTMLNLLDTNRDWTISFDEVRSNSLLISILTPDLKLDGREVLSFGFRAHLRPCPEGSCVESAPLDHCFDRVLDGNETDLDCGGSCRDCKGGAACAVAADCETKTCDAGRCGPPSCTNGVRDGVESDVDCGATCPGCAVGKRCYSNSDCASGECGEPCIPEDESDCLFDDLWIEDTCYPAVP